MIRGFINRVVLLTVICSTILMAAALMALPEVWAAPAYVFISAIANIIFYSVVKRPAKIKSFAQYFYKCFIINASIAIPPIVALTIPEPRVLFDYILFFSCMVTFASLSSTLLGFGLPERSIDPDPSIAKEHAEPFYEVPDVLMQEKNPGPQYESNTLHIASTSSVRSVAGQILIWFLVALVLLTPGYQLLYGAAHWIFVW